MATLNFTQVQNRTKKKLRLSFLNSSGVKSWESSAGAVLEALSSYQCSPGSIPACWDMRIEFVVGSCRAPRVLLRVIGICTLQKNQHLQIPIRLG